MQRFHSAVAHLALAALLSLAAVGGAVAEPRATAADDGSAVASADGVVNLNTATEEELVRLPGIGPKKAQAILSLRQSMKGFSRVEAIMRVKGIGRATFRKLRPMLTLQGKTTLEARPSAGSKR